MAKSLGDYTIKQSSSYDIKNIKWTQKNPSDPEKTKNKKDSNKTSATNIIYTQGKKPKSEKIFHIINSEKTKNKKKKTEKRFQTSSTSNCKIEPGFTRKAR